MTGINGIDPIRKINPYPPIQPVDVVNSGRVRGPNEIATPSSLPTKPVDTGTTPFADVLKQTQSRNENPVEFSRHAIDRISQRSLPFGRNEIQRLGEGIERAATKGSKTSAVVIDDMAMVVAVNNRTVITAMPVEQLKNGVLTNIDSMLFA
ncbi:MAG: flagellar protein [bacterium]|nr:flagellar protein [bacterium]